MDPVGDSLVLAGCRHREMRFHAGEQGTSSLDSFSRAPPAGDVASSFAELAQVRWHRSFASLPLISGVYVS